MAILRVRDENGAVHGIRALKGEPGAGVHVGSYVGNAQVDSSATQYLDLGSPHVKAVLLETTSAIKPIVIVDENPALIDGETAANLIKGTVMGRGDNMFLAVHKGNSTNQEGVTYRYITFIEEVKE